MQRYGVAGAAIVILLGACAGQPEEPDTFSYATVSPDSETLAEIRAEAKVDPVVTAAAMADADEIVCMREVPTGSLIRVRRCYSRAQLERQARRTQDWLADELSQSGTVRDAAPVNPDTP